MPKSKREKEISLTKVKKKTKETKSALIDEVRASVEKYATLFVLSVEGLRSTKFIEVRQHFKSNSRIFFAKNNLMSLALGRSAEDEVANDLHKISELLKGETILMFTNEKASTVRKYLEEFTAEDFARSGAIVDEEFSLPEGKLKEIPGAMEPQLRKLGLPTKLVNGMITLLKDHTICEVGDTLTPEQASLLKIFQLKTAVFHLEVVAMWSKSKGFRMLGG